MSTKYISRIIIAMLCLILTLSVCSCTGGPTNIMQEVNNIKNFATDIVDVASSISNPEVTQEQLIENAKTLIHPESRLSGMELEDIVAELQENEKLQGITSVSKVEIVNMPSIEDLVSMIQYNEELGGNTYQTELEILIDGVAFTIGLSLLSDENGMGIYDYTLK